LISGKTPLILREIWVFPDLTGISPLIFQTECDPHLAITEPIFKSALRYPSELLFVERKSEVFNLFTLATAKPFCYNSIGRYPKELHLKRAIPN
jgi:hypothetical protein